MIRAIYLDLGYQDFCEQYVCFGRHDRYGGGRQLAVALKESNKIICDIWAREEAFFYNGGRELHPRNKTIFWEQQYGIRHGRFIDLKQHGYDILIHHFTDVFVNTNIPQVVWPLGYQDLINANHKDLAMYNTFQNPRMPYNCSPRIYQFVLGCPIPEQKETSKDNFIFQCTRHTPTFGSIEVAKFALQFGIKTIFAGPIDKNYPLLNYIDNKTTFYLGQITENEKIDYTRRAKATTYLHSWPTPMNLSAVQSLMLGTPVVATSVGFWSDLVHDGVNGFLVSDTTPNSLMKAWVQIDYIRQRDCIASASHLSQENMVDSFVNVCHNVLEK